MRTAGTGKEALKTEPGLVYLAEADECWALLGMQHSASAGIPVRSWEKECHKPAYAQLVSVNQFLRPRRYFSYKPPIG